MSSITPGRTATLAALALLLAACGSRPPGQDGAATAPPESTAAPATGVTARRGMMSRGGMMGGMMGARADSAAAPQASAAKATAPGCPPVAQPLVDQGRTIFTGAGNCFSCHGSSANGTALAPNLTDKTWLDIDGSYAAIADLVRTGVAKPKQHPAPMPPLGGASLDPTQVCAVAAYVYSLGHQGG